MLKDFLYQISSAAARSPVNANADRNRLRAEPATNSSKSCRRSPIPVTTPRAGQRLSVRGGRIEGCHVPRGRIGRTQVVWLSADSGALRARQVRLPAF